MIVARSDQFAVWESDGIKVFCISRSILTLLVGFRAYDLSYAIRYHF